jgi:voltage-gated potassium channel
MISLKRAVQYPEMRKVSLEGRLGRTLNRAVLAGTLATIPIVILQERGVRAPWLTAADWTVWIIFFAEYAIGSAFSPNRLKYLRANWMSPLVLILSFPPLPDLLSTVRLARLARVLRFARLARVTLEGRVGRSLNIAVVIGTLLTIPIVVLQERGFQNGWITSADWAVWAIFLLEYSMEMAFTPNRLKYARRNWLSALVIILSFPMLPDLLGAVRLTRLARVLRFARLAGVTLRGLSELRTVLSHRGLLYVALTTLVLVLAGGGGLELVEPKRTQGGYEDGVWWAIVTATTVGYGDIAPATLPGRVIAVVLMLSGIGLISTFSACVTSYFVGQQEHPDTKELRERLERIEHLLTTLQASNGGQPAEIPRYPKEEVD